MNQGKLEVVKQEMARVNINILGISELRWTGMGEFNSDDHYIYCLSPANIRNFISSLLSFSKPSLEICKFLVWIMVNPSMQNLSMTLLV